MANPWPSYDNETWPGGEWVEILNTGNSDLDLTGYSIIDNAGNLRVQQHPFGQCIHHDDDRPR